MTIWENVHMRVYWKNGDFRVYYKHTNLDQRFYLKDIISSIQYESVTTSDFLIDNRHTSVIYIRTKEEWDEL